MTEYEKLRRVAMFDALDRYPAMGTRTMARLLKQQFPEMFPEIEVTRNALNYLRGTNGKIKRNALAVKKYVR